MKKSITAASCSGVYFFTGFNPGILNTALFLFTSPPPSENTSRNRRRGISRMYLTNVFDFSLDNPEETRSNNYAKFKVEVNQRHYGLSEIG